MKRLLLSIFAVCIMTSAAFGVVRGNTIIINQSTMTATTGFFTSLTCVSGTATDIQTATAGISGNATIGGNLDIVGVYQAGSSNVNLTNSAGNILPAILAAGSLPSTVIVSSIQAGTPITAASIMAGNLANTVIVSSVQAGTYIGITIPAANVEAGSLGASVICSSVAVGAITDANQIAATVAPTFATVDTGQGANELYDMNQNVQTSDSPSFVGVTATGGKIGYTDSQGNLNYEVIVTTALAVDIAFPLTPADGKAGSFIVQMGTHTATGTFTSAAVVSLGLSTTDSAGTDAGTLAVYDGGAAIVYIKNKDSEVRTATIRYSFVN